MELGFMLNIKLFQMVLTVSDVSCQYAVLTRAEKDTLNGLYCLSCRQKYDCDSGFDNNSDALYSQLVALLPLIELISRGTGVRGSVNPWSGAMSKPDIIFHFESLIVVVEADDDDGHSVSRGSDISKWGSPWEYSRDLNAEISLPLETE